MCRSSQPVVCPVKKTDCKECMHPLTVCPCRVCLCVCVCVCVCVCARTARAYLWGEVVFIELK
jgi:hypothetical protein